MQKLLRRKIESSLAWDIWYRFTERLASQKSNLRFSEKQENVPKSRQFDRKNHETSKNWSILLLLRSGRFNIFGVYRNFWRHCRLSKMRFRNVCGDQIRRSKRSSGKNAFSETSAVVQAKNSSFPSSKLKLFKLEIQRLFNNSNSSKKKPLRHEKAWIWLQKLECRAILYLKYRCLLHNVM